MRLFFATDIHGSEICWKKFINAGKWYEVDTLILGGDMTGKAIVSRKPTPKNNTITPTRTTTLPPVK